MIGSKFVSSVRMAATYFRTNLRVRHLFFVRHIMFLYALPRFCLTSPKTYGWKEEQENEERSTCSYTSTKGIIVPGFVFVCVFVGMVR
jgi:hypothetical protein